MTSLPDSLGPSDVRRYLERFHRLTLTEPPRPLPSAPDTAVWRCATGPHVHIAKIFPAGRLDLVREEVELLDYLRARAVRTPELLENRRGRKVGLLGRRWRPAFASGKYPVIVMRPEDSACVSPQTVTRDELIRIARCFALMHRILQHYPRRAHVRRTERWSGRLGDFGDFLRSPNARAFDRQALAGLRELDRRMEQRARAALARAPVTESVLHGDLGLHHVRLLGAETNAAGEPYFFDFSDFSCGPVVLDLAVMLSYLYLEDDVSTRRWEQLRGWLLEGYESVLALSGSDRRAIDDALLERLLIEVRYVNRMSLRSATAYDAEGVRKRYRLAEYLLGGETRAPGNRA